MAAQVFSVPEEVPAPEFDDFFKEGGGFDVDAYSYALREHREALAAWCCENSGQKNDLVGKTISFPVADGRAEYMVYTASPLALIHLPYGDAWEVDPIMLRGLRRSDVRMMVERDERLAAFFASREER